MFVAASTQCFADKGFDEACGLLTDLEYDKVEIWLDEKSQHLKPSEVAEDPERFFAHYREKTRLTPVALCLEHDVDPSVLEGLTKLCKLMKVTQLTIPASPIGTPFNEEIDRLRRFLEIANHDGIRLSLKTQIGYLTEDPHTAVELCQSVKGIGLTLDPSHYICGPHKNVSYDQVYPYVYHVHLRDTTPDQLQVQIGLGEIDYSRQIGLLEREDYTRALAVDLDCTQMTAEERPLEMRKMRMLLETLL
ncbi:MAG: xylose isomerase [Planctomycetaceae bacterium]|nr:xylose isomerase [Planctomycetaceae bacterium]